jgi:putative membrane protein
LTIPEPQAESDHAAPPQRLHVLSILFVAATFARSLILPAILAGVSASRRDPGNVTQWMLTILLLPALLGATARFLAFRYRLTRDALIIDSGVLQKQHRVIPFASVQNVQMRATALQRMLGLASVSVETAATGLSAEAELAVLGRSDAEALRREIFARRALERPEIPTAVADETVLVQLDSRDLALAGATANHAGLIAAALAGVIQFLDDLPFLDWPGRFAATLMPQDVGSAVVTVLVLLALLVVAGWIVSIVGSVVRYHGFTLTLRDERLHKQHGLLSRLESMIPLRRVQAIRVEESILRRPLQLASVRSATAGTAGRAHEPSGTQTLTPITRAPGIAPLVRSILPDVAYDRIPLIPVHKRSRLRAFTRYAVGLLLIAASTALWEPSIALGAALLLVPAWLLATWQYRCRGYAVEAGYVLARNGVLNRVTWLVPERKLQTVHVRESPFQRRYGLASVLLDTAGGGGRAMIHDLAYADAVRVVNSLRAAPAAAI